MIRSLVLFWILTLTAAVSAGPVVRDAHVETELIADARAIHPGRPLVVGVRMKHDAHWHTYWQNPGASGLATKIAWDLPEGFTAGDIQWPAPHIFEMGGLINFGYGDQIVLPVAIETPADLDVGSEITMNARVTWLACEEACIPGKADLSITLPVSDGEYQRDARWTDLFDAAAARQPIERDPQHVTAERADGELQLTFTELPDGEPIYFFTGEPNVTAYVDPQTVTREGEQTTLTLPVSTYATDDLSRISGVLQVGETFYAVDVPLGEPPVAAVPASQPIALILCYALMGGALLNLMPCVFPVLSIKILGFVKQAGEQRDRVLKHGLVFGAGVVASFWVLVGVLLALRAGGEQLGWGFQLQEPGFVAVMAVLMFLVGLSFIGAFDFGIGLMNVAGRAQGKVEGGCGGSFFSGVLAVAIATPCTAPFMGPAIGVGLTLPLVQLLLVFTALGVGMALPYVLLSAYPGWLTALPKPGPWMETFKQVMAFPMFAATIWLVWLFGQQVGGPTAMMIMLVGLLFAGIGAWVFGRWRGGVAKFVAAVCVVLSLVAPIGFARPQADLDWQQWSDAAVADARAAGNVVFVDFTADWCLTCKVNERGVLAGRQVADAFAEHDVTLLKADWTLRDETIAAALARFDRAGVPLYVVYSPNADAEPIVLPTVLTPGKVIDAVEQAASRGL